MLEHFYFIINIIAIQFTFAHHMQSHKEQKFISKAEAMVQPLAINLDTNQQRKKAWSR